MQTVRGEVLEGLNGEDGVEGVAEREMEAVEETAAEQAVQAAEGEPGERAGGGVAEAVAEAEAARVLGASMDALIAGQRARAAAQAAVPAQANGGPHVDRGLTYNCAEVRTYPGGTPFFPKIDSGHGRCPAKTLMGG